MKGPALSLLLAVSVKLRLGPHHVHEICVRVFYEIKLCACDRLIRDVSLDCVSYNGYLPFLEIGEYCRPMLSK